MSWRHAWNGCPKCDKCEDREPYSKCRSHCTAYKEWRAKYDDTQAKIKHEAWLNAATKWKRD